MGYAPHPVTILVEEIFATTRELEDATLTDRQRIKVCQLREHAAELERRRALIDTIERVGWTPYTERKARELGFRKAS